MDEFFIYDPLTAGSKGLVFIGDEVLVYRRDKNTKIYPRSIDIPGGGPAAGETPFDTFQREVKEEFGLDIVQSDIVYVKKYPSTLEEIKFAYFPVAKLGSHHKDNIKFGNEGTEYMLISLDEYLGLTDAWPLFQNHAREYSKTLNVG